MSAVPVLYIKRGCPWCRAASAFFSTHGIEVDVRDVTESKADMKRLVEVSGQDSTPTFEFEDFIVSDFSIDDFLGELDERPDIRLRLGFGDNDDES